MSYTWQDYENLKQQWLSEHPEATNEEFDEYRKQLAEDLNL